MRMLIGAAAIDHVVVVVVILGGNLPTVWVVRLVVWCKACVVVGQHLMIAA